MILKSFCCQRSNDEEGNVEFPLIVRLIPGGSKRGDKTKCWPEGNLVRFLSKGDELGRKKVVLPAYLSQEVFLNSEQHSVVSEDLSKKMPAEDESDALNLNGEVTEYSDQETDAQSDWEDKPVHEEDND
ncbi:hypothetical protein AVEN_23630-1 [Araneus ventricosus]|uniref:Uncharacterized protein n=1 Tax=Araneus ventricosus TaxID=182803 RepID=A0A4Y2BHP2_ARAVE|nr:hypothetical protein AVEN_23630-1 [Araneus ventricosus]